MEKQEKNTVTPYDLDGRPPLKLAIPLGLQHVLAMFVGNLTMIITAACGIEAGGKTTGSTSAECHADHRYCNIGSGIYPPDLWVVNSPSLWEPVPVSLAYARVLQESWVMGGCVWCNHGGILYPAVFLKLYWETSWKPTEKFFRQL